MKVRRAQRRLLKSSKSHGPDNGPSFRYYRTMQPRQISILGVGLLGGSLGLALKNAANDCKIIGYSHRRSTLDAAIRLGAIQQGYEELGPAVRGSDLVILCTPVGLFPDLIKQLAPLLSQEAIVTDVGSTKETVVSVAEKLLPPGVHFVGSHPMAGSEKRGIEHARADLYSGALCILTPTSKTNPAALERIDSFWKSLGMRTCRISPEEHDRRLADVSHLPHALAAALVNLQDPQGLGLAAKGFLDLTRIAGGDSILWRDIFLDNRQNLLQSIDRLKQELDRLATLLDPAQAEALQAWLQAAASRRQVMLEKAGK